MFTLRGLIVTALLTSALAWPARADDIRPAGWLERGEFVARDEEVAYVPDAQRGRRGGRWFRLDGSEGHVFYGLGGHPGTDWLWPNHVASPFVWEIVSASPGGTSYLLRYQDAAAYTTGLARVGTLVALGSLAATLGGVGYNLTNATREMQPVFFVGTGAALLAGVGLWAGATAAASSNEALLDQALDAYNRDLAGRRRRQADGAGRLWDGKAGLTQP
ncbi:MAG: hypothetical protein VKQ33_01875 [Candidatus Sericytochromatia bacterium]|nr:hypothetical protein [Candidatus Sericytochromatia bacterium]